MQVAMHLQKYWRELKVNPIVVDSLPPPLKREKETVESNSRSRSLSNATRKNNLPSNVPRIHFKEMLPFSEGK